MSQTLRELAGTPRSLPDPGARRSSLADRYLAVRQATEALAEPLAIEDQVVQSMPDASPTKWHLAHTTWFFETFVLEPALRDYESPDPQFAYLFNSYYNAVGAQYSRADRGLVTRPTVDDVRRYRAYVDRHMLELLAGARPMRTPVAEAVVELGLQHEQQHQELVLTDVKHLLARNPLYPVYRPRTTLPRDGAAPLGWVEQPGGVFEIGHEGPGFAYDNETPRHRAYVNDFRLATRLVTAGEYLAFIDDGGYRRPELWLSEGWKTVRERGWTAPLYWGHRDGCWWQFTLSGRREVVAAEPLCHVSYFEADAYARWAGARLPTEAEWEVVARERPIGGNFVEDLHFHPIPTSADGPRPAQLFGDVWEWTGSAYLGYPGYRPPEGALGEYNGKFMCNQFVLRGGSCATPRSLIRASYRNFFPPDARWQFSGVRLAADA